MLIGVFLLQHHLALATLTTERSSNITVEGIETTSQPLAYNTGLATRTKAVVTQDSSSPVFTFSDQSSSDVGQQVTLTIEAAAANTGDQITLAIDSAVALGNNTAANFAGASFGPTLPQTASGTARTVMNWVPKKEHRGYIEFFFSAQDQHGNKSQESVLYFVDMPLVIKPVPALQLAAGEPFESIITIEDADWHQLYEASFMEEAPAWLQAETINRDGNSAIRLWGTPDEAATGSYQLMLYAETIFGKWDTSVINIEVTNGGEDCLATQQLSLRAGCSDNPATERQWLIQNPNSCAITVSWWVHKSSQQGSLLVEPGETYFTTASVGKGVDMVYISWTDASGQSSQKRANATTAKCNKQKSKPRNHRIASAVLSTTTPLAYPMPFGEKLYLSHSNITATSTASIQMISMNGEQYNLSNQLRITGEGKIELELQQSSIPAGMYMLKLWVDNADPMYIRVMKSQD